MALRRRDPITLSIPALLCVGACGPAEDNRSAPSTQVAGIERVDVSRLSSSTMDMLFGHSWLECEFGRFSQHSTQVSERILPSGAVEVVVAGVPIPRYMATFTLDPDRESCSVAVRWHRDSGFDDQLSGSMTLMEGSIWIGDFAVLDGRVQTDFAFRLHGLREDEPVYVCGEAVLRADD